ncbi:MAG: transposase [Candidatus Micrarchaeota archaeon]|nr:transposase [Candidatus Micrarchaeota archaeon]
MLRAYKLRMYPTKREKKTLNRQMLLAKELYNLLLEKAKTHYKETNKTLSRNTMNLWITKLKVERNEFTEMYTQVLQNVADRVSKAYSNFFKRVKEKGKGKKIKAGFPRAKTFVQSLTYPQFGFIIIPNKKRIQVSNIGTVETVFDREIEGKVKTLTIKKSRSLEWYACIIVESEDKPFASNDKEKIGVDLGIESFVTLSNGQKIENKRYEKKSSGKLRRLHRRVSRKLKGGNNRRKAVIKLARLSEHIARQRNDYLNKISHSLVNSYSLIVYEKLNINSMLKNHNIARSINDVSWGNFIKMLCYKAESAGCRAIGVNPRNTSKMCNRCGSIKEMPLSERIFSCSACGIRIDRDINAARNILNEGTAGHAGSNASGEVATTATKIAASSLHELGTIHGNCAIGNPCL